MHGICCSADMYKSILGCTKFYVEICKEDLVQLKHRGRLFNISDRRRKAARKGRAVHNGR